MEDFLTIPTSTPDLEDVQNNIDRCLHSLSQFDHVHAKPIPAGTVYLAAGAAVAVVHGLKRVPVGWFITDKNADCRIWRAADSTDTYLYLQTSANVTIRLLVY